MATRGRYGYALGDGRYKFIQIDHDAEVFGNECLSGITYRDAKAEIDSIVNDKGLGEYYYPSDNPMHDEGTPLETATNQWYVEYVYTVDEDDTLTRYNVEKHHQPCCFRTVATVLTNPTIIRGDRREKWYGAW